LAKYKKIQGLFWHHKAKELALAHLDIVNAKKNWTAIHCSLTSRDSK
jgi:hypothetical protein